MSRKSNDKRKKAAALVQLNNLCAALKVHSDTLPTLAQAASNLAKFVREMSNIKTKGK